MKPFQTIGSIRPRKTPWNLSYTKKFTCDMGQLIPIMCDECVPGDTWKIANEIVVRFQPLLAPILHQVSVYTHYFFVPYRLLWSDWEKFISGGEDGNYTGTLPSLQNLEDSSGLGAEYSLLGSLCDYLYNIVPSVYSSQGSSWQSDGRKSFGVSTISAFPIQAYNLIWNEYYRDENVDSEVELWNGNVLRARWKKDYFTSALPWRQRGTAPALPVSVSLPSYSLPLQWSYQGGSFRSVFADAAPSSGNRSNLSLWFTEHDSGGSTIPGDLGVSSPAQELTATTFDVNDMRLAFQVQKWLERNARGGARYTEFLRSHFGVSPTDSRLDRPEYIGGTKSGVIFSEVLQTSGTGASGTDTAQGNMAGHGVNASSGYVGAYHVQEYGLIMGIMSVRPVSSYSYGINRQWLRESRYDFYFPEFAHLGEQAIQNREIWENFSSVGSPEDDIGGTTARGIFGYQGRYDEMRYKPSTVHSGMRKTFDYWHLSREFDSQPHLNSAFLDCNPSKRIFAVQDEDGLIVNFANKIRAIRPIPYIAEPGLIDHS